VAGPQRFFDPSQPQTLQIATVLLYIDAFFTLLVSLPFAVVFAASGYGMANGKKWGYMLALSMAGLRLFLLLFGKSMTEALSNPIGLMFAIALVALLVHPQSREYQKIWYS